MRRVLRLSPVVAMFTYAFLHIPLVILVVFAFNRSRLGVQWGGFTLEWFARLGSRPDVLRALRGSLIVGVTSSLIATVLGTMAALALSRMGDRRKRAVQGALYLPIVTPEVVAGISLLVLFASLGVPLGFGTIIVAHSAFSLPFVVIVVLARLQGADPALEEAAMSLGADELSTFRRVTLPQMMPGVLAAALLAFTLSFDDFVITFFVAGAGSTTLPLVVYSMARRTVEPTINAITVILIGLTTVFVLLADHLARRGTRP